MLSAFLGEPKNPVFGAWQPSNGRFDVLKMQFLIRNVFLSLSKFMDLYLVGLLWDDKHSGQNLRMHSNHPTDFWGLLKDLKFIMIMGTLPDESQSTWDSLEWNPSLGF